MDFYCHRANLVVEIDGDIHKSRIEADTMRGRILNSLGLVIFHISNEQLEKNLEDVLSRIRGICIKQTPDLERYRSE